jgi:chromosome segregation ATPase
MSDNELQYEVERLRAELAAEQNRYKDLLQSWAEVKELRDNARAELAAAITQIQAVIGYRPDTVDIGIADLAKQLAAEKKKRQQEYEETARQLNEAVCALAAERERVKEMAKMIAEARSRPDALRADKAEAELAALSARHERALIQGAKLREALERIADTDPDDGTAWFHGVARAALKETKGGGNE